MLGYPLIHKRRLHGSFHCHKKKLQVLSIATKLLCSFALEGDTDVVK